MLRRMLLSASNSEELGRLVSASPLTRPLVDRFVSGETAQDAARAARALAARGLHVSLDRLGEDTADAAEAAHTRDAYLEVLDLIGRADLAPRAEVSLKLSSLGQFLPRDGERIALDHARAVCAGAAERGTTVTLDMEDHTTTDSTLGILRELRRDFPETGVALQACLYRTEADCRDLAGPGSRVRLCKGAYREPESVAPSSRAEVDRAYVRCLKILMAGEGYPMVATHDPRLIEIAGALAVRHGRPQGAYEFQMLYGIRPEEQQRLAAAGETTRVYVPFGDDWYAYFMRRLAERPANLAFFLRSLVTKD
ncbi:proline dehydrogenase family protein [Allostreptomyces psammosilenae]|uniref:proline dehydrogenase n=1 Tax=Allostreptomyces psammosilenae TaxID=1892865 RepID=A0A853A5E9_9ACTN|nr:proline dehydrogenase family protein [Allostreptomyces psammosilenae]NYI05748.1 proline dehydrogenase [Allostreptomyces psammosilenae]